MLFVLTEAARRTLLRVTFSHVVAAPHEHAKVARDLGALTRLLLARPGAARGPGAPGSGDGGVGAARSW